VELSLLDERLQCSPKVSEGGMSIIDLGRVHSIDELSTWGPAVYYALGPSGYPM
jgi:hypothetical protein